jgi:hypothetical protein
VGSQQYQQRVNERIRLYQSAIEIDAEGAHRLNRMGRGLRLGYGLGQTLTSRGASGPAGQFDSSLNRA